MSNLSVAWTGGSSYVVYSPSEDGESNAYRVELTSDSEPTCNCEHGTHNQSDTAACKHVREAIKAHDSHPDLEYSIIQQYAGLIRDAETAYSKAQAALQGAQEANVAARETEAAAVQEATDAEVAAADPDGQADQEAAGDAAQRLREAYDDVEGLTDMQVQEHVGHVWIQTGQDTPDELDSGPVTIDVWEQFISNPDQVMYIYEGDDGPDHELFEEKPGEWWKNALEPGDVDQYIEEVLGVTQ